MGFVQVVNRKKWGVLLLRGPCTFSFNTCIMKVFQALSRILVNIKICLKFHKCFLLLVGLIVIA